MIRAEDFLDDTRDRANLLSDLRAQPEEVKRRLTSEFLEIIGDPTETQLRRTQSAAVVAFSAGDLGIKGLKAVAEFLERVFEDEFFPIEEPRRTRIVGTRPAGLRDLSGTRLFLLKHLIVGLIVTDPVKGKSAAKRIEEIISDREVATWLKKVMSLRPEGEDSGAEC